MKIKPSTKTPEQRAAVDDNDDARFRYLRSYVFLRTVIGVIGIGLPVTLLAGDGLFLSGEVPRGSLSAYYHTGMRDFFVGTLFAIAVFLITYEFFHYNWYNLLTMTAGVAAWGVAVFPTGGNDQLTPLQERLGERLVSTVHGTCAAVFILSLAVISLLFGRRKPDEDEQAWRRRRRLHWGCASAIIVAVLYVLLTKWLGEYDRHSLFYGETVATFAFGLSWLVKGLELKPLLHRDPPGDDGGPALGAEEAIADGSQAA